MKKKIDFKKSEKYFFCFFVIVCFFYYLLWSVSKGFNYGPDEYVRYDVPLYIYKHGVLPNGFIEELRNPYWGFSYAFYPTFLGPIMSAFFMKVMSFFTTEEIFLVIAARFTSVIFGTLTIYYVYRIGEKLFSTEYKWLFTIFVAMIPQYAFLTSYVNNDIICVCGSAMIIDSWVSGMLDRWNWKNSVLLSLGIVVCALSYYNSYGWIMLSAVVFLMSFILKINNNQDYKKMLRMAGIMCLIVLACISYFFIRNAILYDGDFLGMRALTNSSELYAMDELKPSLRNTPEHMGVSLLFMLYYMGWIRGTYLSFIGHFGYINTLCPIWIHVFYFVLIFLAIIGTFASLAKAIYLNRKFGHVLSRLKCLLHTALIAGILIVVALSLYYSYYVDFSPQGRYCYPMIVAFAYFFVYGLSNLRLLKISKKGEKVVVGCLCAAFVLINIYCYAFVFLPA